MLRQLAATWLVGSAVTGTIAVLFTSGRSDLPFRPLVLFSDEALFTLAVLLLALTLATFAIGWRTQDAGWLPRGGRGVLLWTILVTGGGLGRWGFAAAVTFHAEFSLTAQLILAYTCGGLPFTLIAAMLAKPHLVNAVAAMVTAIALLIGVLLLDGRISTLVAYLQMLFWPAATEW